MLEALKLDSIWRQEAALIDKLVGSSVMVEYLLID